MKTCKENLRLAICGTGFLFSMLVTVIALCSASFESFMPALQARNAVMPSDFFFQILQEAVSSETMCFVLPIVAALPFTASFYDDLHSGFIKAYLPRTGYRDYIVGKWIACYVSGGLVSVSGVLAFAILCGATFAPKMFYAGALRISFREISPILQRCIPLFFSGAFWSLIGMTAAAFTNSKHMAYAAPFILFYVLVILSERYFKKIVFLNPKVWMGTANGIQGAVLLSLMTVLVSLAFIYSAGRRLRNL